MTRLDLLGQCDISLASELIYVLGRKFDTVNELEKHLSYEVTENELQQINAAARKEGLLPIVFIP